MMHKVDESPPVVLVVEDEEGALTLRRDALLEFECTPIGVRSHDDAIRELRASPAIDLVLTDIHLGSARDDKSGIALARFIRSADDDLPILGYSAYFGDQDFSSAETEILERVFTDVWAKAELDFRALEERMGVVRALALEYRQARRERTFERHVLLQRHHEAERPDFELMRELRPGAGPAAPVEEALSRAGYRLEIVEASVGLLTESVIVWLLDVDGGVEAEVYGQPALYAEGQDDEEAIAQLVELIHLVALDEGDVEKTEAAGPAVGLTEFLRRVVHRESEK